jgi:alpha-D-ribose 1-methylphosphonate 5-triphosphate synthase subunit PhnG
MSELDVNENQRKRQYQLSVLAKSNYADIIAVWSPLNIEVNYHCLKAPETGMVMVKARAGGEGSDFNMGEMTVTRTVVQLENKQLGFGYCSGRDHKKSELIAMIDAASQLDQYSDVIAVHVIDELARKNQNANQQQKEKVDSTKVNFFTMVRGK